LDRGRGLEAADKTDKSYEAQLEEYDGLLVPGGFGKRGIEGMLRAIQYAREKQVPYFGICLECRQRALNMRATSAGWRTPTPASSIRRLRIA